MSHPSCNSSDLLHSGTRKYSLFEVHRRGNYAAYVRPLYVHPQATCSQGLAASMRLFVLPCRAVMPLSLSACLLSHRQGVFDCVHIPRRVFALTTCGVSCIRLYVCRKRTDFSNLAAEAVALRLAAFSTLLLRDTAAALNLLNDFCFPCTHF